MAARLATLLAGSASHVFACFSDGEAWWPRAAWLLAWIKSLVTLTEREAAFLSGLCQGGEDVASPASLMVMLLHIKIALSKVYYKVKKGERVE